MHYFISCVVLCSRRQPTTNLFFLIIYSIYIQLNIESYSQWMKIIIIFSNFFPVMFWWSRRRWTRIGSWRRRRRRIRRIRSMKYAVVVKWFLIKTVSYLVWMKEATLHVHVYHQTYNVMFKSCSNQSDITSSHFALNSKCDYNWLDW